MQFSMAVALRQLHLKPVSQLPSADLTNGVQGFKVTESRVDMVSPGTTAQRPRPAVGTTAAWPCGPLAVGSQSSYHYAIYSRLHQAICNKTQKLLLSTIRIHFSRIHYIRGASMCHLR